MSDRTGAWKGPESRRQTRGPCAYTNPMSSAPNPPFTRARPLAFVLGDARVKVAEMDPRLLSHEGALFPEEAVSVERAVLTRRQQYGAGRVLARRVLAELGHEPVALLNDAQRVPIWPAGIVGSITHTHHWCGVAVARSTEVAALGADVEVATPLELGLWERVCRPEEREFLSEQEPERGGLLAKAVFSAKESIYKALYPQIRVFLDFQAMRIELSAPEGDGPWHWHAVLQVPWGRFAPGERFGPGRLAIDATLITTAIIC
jgi:4'-phosphopantetheinyl transferase EntD